MFRIKKILKEKGLTQKDLALKMNVKQETISRQINGNPTINTLKDIADALQVSVKDLFISTKETELVQLIVKNELHTFDGVDDAIEFLEQKK